MALTLKERASYGEYRRAGQAICSSSSGQSGHSGQAGAFIHTYNTADGEAITRPIEDTGLRIGEVTATRCWRLIEDRLHSTYKTEYIWEPDSPMIGDVRDEYGVHAFKEITYVIEYAHEITHWDWMWSLDAAGLEFEEAAPAPTIVIGTVSLWGEIVEHDKGYRAEFARIKTLDSVVGGGEHAILVALRKYYGVQGK